MVSEFGDFVDMAPSFLRLQFLEFPYATYCNWSVQTAAILGLQECLRLVEKTGIETTSGFLFLKEFWQAFSFQMMIAREPFIE